jgi:hypothetical protein
MIAADRYVVAEYGLLKGSIWQGIPFTPGIFDHASPASSGIQIILIDTGYNAGFAPGANLGV